MKRLAIGVLGLGLSLMSSLALVAQQQRDDIVLILTDDQRADSMWAMPQVRELFSDGITFVQSFVNSPLCSPNRASLFSGLFPWLHRIVCNDQAAGTFDWTQTVFTELRAAGYWVCYSGKSLNGYDYISMAGRWPFVPPGFDDFTAFRQDKIGYEKYKLMENGVGVDYGTGAKNYSTTVTAQKLIDCIKAAPIDQPVFATWAPYAPHPDPKPLASDLGMFNDRSLPRPPSFNEADISDKPYWLRNGSFPKLTASEITSLETTWRRYHETLLPVDRKVPEIRDLFLTARGRDPWMVYTADNGATFGEHRLGMGKACMYEECIRVPLLIRGPGVVDGGRQDASLVQTFDVTSTILEMAGVTSTMPLSGMSLVPILEHRASGWRQHAYVQYGDPNHRKPFDMVLTERYRYAVMLDKVTLEPKGGCEFYDLATDPWQLVNRVSDPWVADDVARMRALLPERECRP